MSYEKLLIDLSFPSDAAAVVPSDGSDLPRAGRLFVGGAGAVKVTTIAGTDVTFTGVVAGTVLPVRVKKVFATGTTATNMVVMYSKYDN